MLHVYENPEKVLDITEPTDERGVAPVHPCRIVMAGPAGCGKRNLALNLLKRLQLRFDKWSVLTLDKKTTEWQKIEDQPGFRLFSWDDSKDRLPPLSEFTQKDGRSVLLIDEAPFSRLGRERLSQLERLFAHGSSHGSLSLIIMHQKCTSIPIEIRNNCQYFCLWATPMRPCMRYFEDMLGLPIRQIMQGYGRKDCLCMDVTGAGPLLRKNWFYPFEWENGAVHWTIAPPEEDELDPDVRW